ncbi:MAG: hypothetical protein BWK76_06060 [Desulfobulbaceae bacterium A2]|nr:MAG: hypothetical protein BWK76_06060 [Desulfobulbaceae bacterium A2]
MEVVLNQEQTRELAQLYTEMEVAYDRIADKIRLKCSDCDDNCCDSFFHHHTHCEWAYLWQGLRELPPLELAEVQQRAQNYVAEIPGRDTRSTRHLPCPLVKDGRCVLYQHRLMICRLHGVPSLLRRPDGQRLNFPGCFRSQLICTEQPALLGYTVDRTPFLVRLARLEKALVEILPGQVLRPRLTIAEMIVNGPPTVA